MKSIGWVSWMGIACVTIGATLAAQGPDEPGTFSVRITMNGNAPRLSRQAFDDILTFNIPVLVPGARLEAGTYLFTIISPKIVRVMSADRTKIYSTFFTQPVTRSDANYGELKFKRDQPSTPPRIVAIYHEGSKDGYQPVYPQQNQTAASDVAP